MMASKFILVFVAGAIKQQVLRKPQAPRSRIAWIGQAASSALNWKTRHYVFRIHGEWGVYGVDYPRPLKTFPLEAQAAAEMYLIHLANKA
jgi:hypothetical protein